MECRTYGVSDVARMLGISEKSVYAMADKRIIHRLKDVPKMRFSKKEIDALCGIEDEFNVWNYRSIKADNEKLKLENQKLKELIKKATAELLLMSSGLVEE
ncbi:helix-turn-helix domain-containing protein [Veillonella sp. R32]|uniref:helix-turn-helix domain-containing protein n=1 Tax=Veillonella sp. R32 TaxID=2021312 RepID=UPI00138A55F9|nr:helix-turn-helix domain-containing protein [Veillonella sp. R32]KAF1680470.1 hypothetical protein VER_08520 [Veillonella sp. R32]